MRKLSLRQRFRVALLGYAVSLIFALAIFVSRKLAPTLSSPEQLLLGAAAALPAALALLWERLSNVKLGEIQITLAEVTPEIDFELANAIQDVRGSLTPQLVQAIGNAIGHDDLTLMEVNLRTEPYWWSTRLYLTAALAHEYTAVERLVFVDLGPRRLYLGMAPPLAVRQALAARFPILETVFSSISATARQGSTDHNRQVETIGYLWETKSFGAPDTFLNEEGYRELVSAANLREWLDGRIETERCEWDGSPSDNCLYRKILSCQVSFVPLIHSGRLEVVVNRQSLANKIALSVV